MDIKSEVMRIVGLQLSQLNVPLPQAIATEMESSTDDELFTSIDNLRESQNEIKNTIRLATIRSNNEQN